MSEASNESSGSGESSRGITDDQLPDDLNPEKNPLAAEPEDEDGAAGAGGD